MLPLRLRRLPRCRQCKRPPTRWRARLSTRFSYHNGRRLHTFPTLGIQVVIECCKHNLMTDQSAVAYGYAALVLKTASGIYEHVFAHRYVFAAVGVKGRKQQKRFVCFLPISLKNNLRIFSGGRYFPFIFAVIFRALRAKRCILRCASEPAAI